MSYLFLVALLKMASSGANAADAANAARETPIAQVFAVQKYMNAILSDTVNEGSVDAHVRWVTKNGKKRPDVSCLLINSKKSLISCDVGFSLKLEGVAGRHKEQCLGLVFYWDGKEVVEYPSKSDEDEDVFDSCLESLTSFDPY